VDFPQDVIERFWSKVDKSGGPEACWPWTRSKNAKGYGQCWTGERIVATNRFASMLCDRAPKRAERALHSCDNPPCCNPKHLRWGTSKQNTADCFERNANWRAHLQTQGRKIGLSRRRLSATQVRAIRGKLATGTSQAECGREYGLTRMAISDIANRKSYRDL
jgi:hypothetical protein